MDNCFHDGDGRFPTIEEDAARLRLLALDFARHYARRAADRAAQRVAASEKCAGQTGQDGQRPEQMGASVRCRSSAGCATGREDVIATGRQSAEALRLARATWLLQETNLKLAEIAEACGYRDVYFFARQFRRFMGRPPGAWRKG